jgi:hypothetical protein
VREAGVLAVPVESIDRGLSNRGRQLVCDRSGDGVGGLTP